MDVNVFIDKINIKNLPEIITDYLRKNSVKEYNNLRSFYSRLLDSISDSAKDSYLNRILKYLSASSPAVINLLDDFNEGIYDKELLDFSRDLVEVINETDDYLLLYETLNRNVNILFYETEKEFCDVKTRNNNSEYDMFIFLLLKHAFSTYKINIPGIMAKRLLEEGLTLSFNTEHRKRVIEASAILGNELANKLHAAHIYSEDRDKAVEFLLKNKNSAGELWQIAFELESNSLSKHTVQHIQEELKEILQDNDFTNRIKITEYGKEKYYDLTLSLAIKIYYYITCNFGFSKAYNSLGKLMIFNSIIYDNDRKETIELAKSFLNRAIRMGNLNSITNLSIYYYNNKDDEEYDFLTMKRFLEQAACLGDTYANCYYGKILFDEGNYKEGVKYLTFAADRNYGLACFELGKYYELQSDYETSLFYYKKAIINRNFDAAYNISLLFHNMNKISDTEKFSNDSITYYLETYIDKMHSNVREKAQKLLDKYK